MLIMCSSIFFKCLSILLFLLLAVTVDSQACGSIYEDPFKPLVSLPHQEDVTSKWPWMVAIRKRELTSDYYPWCSGFLIDRKHVISAAHCFHARGDDQYRARIGNVNQNKADEYGITRIVVPAGYTKGLFYDDIAVLTLDREVNFTNFIPVCLPNEEVIIRMSSKRIETTVAGWRTDGNGGEMENYLDYVSRLSVIPNEECERRLRRIVRDSFQRHFPRGVNRDFICAAFSGAYKGACGIDSGGPQMFRMGYQWYAIGVASFGLRGVPGLPSGYTRVENYIDWIKENTTD